MASHYKKQTVFYLSVNENKQVTITNNIIKVYN